MKRNKLLAMMLAALMLLSACGSKEEPAAAPSAPASDKYDMMVETPAVESESSITMVPEYATGGAGESVYQRADAKLIRRCSIDLQTTEFDAAVSALYELVDSHGGYFENSSVHGGGYYNANARRSGEYVVRVPAERYGAFRSSVGDLGYITFINESTEDIGEQYYDTEARLKTLRTKQERLLMLLEKAETMEDIITLESALGDVEYEIERHSSTLNRYDGLVSFATFNINLNEVKRVEEQTGQADSLGERMGTGFRSGLENLKESFEALLVWLSYNFVGVIMLIAVAGVVAAIIRRKKPRLPKLKKNGKIDEIE